jgi:hypothetical protein
VSDQGPWNVPPQQPNAQQPNAPQPQQRTPPPAQAFAPPSNPAFGQGVPPTGRPQQAAWPSAGQVAFTPHAAPSRGVPAAGLVLAIVGAIIGLAVGWGFPLSAVALVLALIGRRRAGASRGITAWTIGLVVLSALASVGWLVYSIVYILS